MHCPIRCGVLFMTLKRMPTQPESSVKTFARPERLRRRPHRSSGVWRRRCAFKHAVADGPRGKDQRSNGKKLSARVIQLCLPILVTSVDGFLVCQVPLWRLETSLPCIRCSGEGEHIRLARMAFRSEETRPNGLGLHAGIEWNRVRRRIRIIERPCSRLCHSLASYCLQCLLRGNVSTVTENSTFNFCYPGPRRDNCDCRAIFRPASTTFPGVVQDCHQQATENAFL